MGFRSGSITFGGLSSGLPVNDLIKSLVDLQRRPIDILQRQRTDFQTRFDLLTDLSNRTRTLRDSLRKLDDLADNVESQNIPASSAEFRSFTATSSAPTILTATASGSATASNLRVQVTQLAQEDREVSTGFATKDTAVFNPGDTLTITVGTDAPVTVTVDASSQTLESFASAIHSSAANVSAFVLDDGSAGTPFRLVVTGATTGAAQQVSFTGSLTGTLAFTETQNAQDAQLLLDPGASQIALSSATNQFTNVLKGVSIDAVSAAPGTDVTVRVQTDIDSIVSKVSAAVTAFNSVGALISEQSKVDPSTNRGGPLLGDSVVTRLQRDLGSVLATSFGTGTIQTAGQVGLSLDRQGVLSLDETKLRSALATSIDGVSTFFSGAGGFADALRNVADAFVRPTDPSDPTGTAKGILLARIDGQSRAISDLDTRIQRAQDRLDTFESDLVRRFSALESTISGIQAQGSFLAQFLGIQQQG
ncbi:MAG: flagellar filament capping protein FliD [Myxococcota bacterium]